MTLLNPNMTTAAHMITQFPPTPLKSWTFCSGSISIYQPLWGLPVTRQQAVVWKGAYQVNIQNACCNKWLYMSMYERKANHCVRNKVPKHFRDEVYSKILRIIFHQHYTHTHTRSVLQLAWELLNELTSLWSNSDSLRNLRVSQLRVSLEDCELTLSKYSFASVRKMGRTLG